MRTNEKISFVTLNFTGIGDNTLDIVGTEYLSGLTEITTDTTSDLMPSVDYDDGSIYTTITVAFLIIGGIVGVIILAVKRRK